MKNYTSLLIFLFLACNFSLAQDKNKSNQNGTKNVLTVVEQLDRKNDTVDLTKSKIVDINASLEVHVSKSALIDKLATNFPQFKENQQLKQQQTILSNALENSQTILSLVRNPNRTQVEDRNLSRERLAFKNAIANNQDYVDKYNELDSLWNIQYGQSKPFAVTLEQYVITKFNEEASEVQKSLESLDNPNIQVSLVAFLKNKSGLDKDQDPDRVHIENFDTYARGQFYTVERWVTSLSADQLEDLKELSDKAEQLNQGAVDAFANLKSQLTQYFEDIACVKDLIKQVDEFINNSNVIGKLTDAAEQDLANLKSEINRIVGIVQSIETDVENLSIATVFDAINKIEQIRSILMNFPGLKDQLSNTLAAISQIKTEADAFIKDVTDCYSTVEAKVKSIADALGLMKGEQNNYMNNNLITDQVKKFGVDNIPETGYITLEYTGPRQNGDKLMLDLVAIVPQSGTSTSSNSNGGSDNQPATEYVNHVIERHLLTMQLIGLRSETAVGIIMADPLNAEKLGDDLPDDRRFLYAPSASLLLKFGSRDYPWYNNFVDPGIGIIVSTPDFNTDGTPEFGVGGVITVFKDILSIGYSYNVTLDLPYWHFGVNLPFNLPGIPINSPR